MGTKRVLGRNMAWNTAGLVIETAVGFLVMPFLILRLGEATYGVWIVLGALTSYFGLLDLGIRSSVGRHVALHHANGNRTGVNQTVTGGLAILLLVGLAALVAVLAGESLFFRVFEVPPERHADTALALKIVALQFALFVLSTGFDATLWGYQRFDWLNAVDSPAAILRAGLTIALVRSADDLVVLACITLGVTAASALAKALLCFRADPHLRVGRRYLSRPALRELLGFGSWNLIGNVARVTRRQLSPLLIGSLLGLSLVAPFSIADRLLVAVAAALAAVTGVLTPFATALHATDQTERQRRLFLIGGQHSSAFAFFLIAFLLVFGGPLIALWIGPQFSDAALLLTILAVGELLPSTQYVTNSILVASARHRALAAFGVLETISVCILLAVLLPTLGLIGCGLAIAIPAALFRGLAPLVQGCRVVGVPVAQYLIQTIGPPLLCIALPAGIAGLVARIHPPTTWLLFFWYSAGFALLFAACYASLLGRAQLRTLRTRAPGHSSDRQPELAGPNRESDTTVEGPVKHAPTLPAGRIR